jgi:hypothetical protein
MFMWCSIGIMRHDEIPYGRQYIPYDDLHYETW